MNYAIVRKGKVIEAPVSMVSCWNGVRGFHKLSHRELIDKHGWYPCEVVNEMYNPIYQNRSLPKIEFDEVFEKVTISYVITEKPIEQVRPYYFQKIKEAFEDDLRNGKMVSSLGFTVDNRRSELKFDKDNVQSLIDIGVAPINFKDINGDSHALTIEQLVILRNEMVADGLNKYERKWEAEELIKNATSYEELENVEY